MLEGKTIPDDPKCEIFKEDARRPSFKLFRARICDRGLYFIVACTEFDCEYSFCIHKLHELCPESVEKPFASKLAWAYRFLKRKRFSIRRITRNVTIDDEESARRAESFLQSLQERYSRNESTVFVNMDQTAVTKDVVGRTTITVRGATSVPTNSVIRQGDRVTVALTVASNGDKLPPLAVFHGTLNGTVAKSFSRRENPFPTGIHYRCNQSAWMTEQVMLDWIDLVLLPYASRIGNDNICLILDSFSVHIMESIRNVLTRCSIETIYIPGGLTKDYQPLDVGVNGPFKHWLNIAFTERQKTENQKAGEMTSVSCLHK